MEKERKKVNLLAIDTSSDNLSLAVRYKEKVVVNINRKLRFGASRLPVYIQRCVTKHSIALEKLDALVVGKGPGSFTGLRISFSIIKALSLALKKPIVSISSFLAVAYPFLEKEKVAVIADARRNLIYAAAFSKQNHTLRLRKKECLTTPRKFGASHRQYFFLTYDSFLREEMKHLFPGARIHPYNVYPQAQYLLSLAEEAYGKGNFEPVEKLVPLYLHPKTCQIRKK